MKKNYLLPLIFCLFYFISAHSQELVVEMPFENQISVSHQVVEGKVIKKETRWNSKRNFIYTVSTIEVYKVFKGQNVSYVKVVTPGGFKDGQGMTFYPSLKLHNNEIGLFILGRSNVELLDENSGTTFFKPTGRIQGFYGYDILTDTYANHFTRGENIETKLYNDIRKITKKNYSEIKKLNTSEQRESMLRTAAPNDITSISPLTTSGGTGDILTISGSGFGNTFGTISFPNPNDGGSTYLEAYDSHITRWTDTEILIEVPSFAGTGVVRVRTAGGNLFFSDELTISYAHINVETQDASVPAADRFEYETQFYNRDNNGGYEWFYNSNFASNTPAVNAFERAFFQWVCTTGVQWQLAGNTTRRPNIVGEAADSFNVVGFRDDVDDDPTDGTTIAYAISRYIGCENGVGDLDVAVEDTDLVYNSDLSFNYGPGNGSGGQIDFETVSLHELGHGHQLGHIIDPGAIMHFAINGGSVNRELDANDITGGTAVFNRSNNDQICGFPLMTQSACSLSTDDIIAESVSIYPNPANTEVNIKTQNNIIIKTLNLLDVSGRVVLNKTITNNDSINTIDVRKMSNGVYFLKIDSNLGTLTKKIIIQ